jgi:TRAP transporter TAXI family solute receptor
MEASIVRYALWTAAFIVVAGLAGLAHFWSPHATLRVTTGGVGTDAQLFVGALVTQTSKDHPRIRLQPIEVADLAASAKAIERGAANLAIIRTDVSPPSNGQTIAILRRDVVAFIVPPDAGVDSISKLSGKTIAIPEGRLQEVNAALLDVILGYYNVAPSTVKRVFLSPEPMAAAIHHKHIAAILAIGPVGPGDVTSAITAAAKGSSRAPVLLAFSDAGAFAKRFPAFESYDVPEGAFRARPAIPDDTLTTLAVTYRLVAPERMLNLVAGAIGQTIFTSKSKLIALTSAASQIEAPDTDDKNPILPVHPGVANYLSNGEQSFFDEFQGYFYLAAAGLSVMGSLVTVAMGRMKTTQSRREKGQISQLVQIARQARGADAATLKALNHAFHKVVDDALSGDGPSDRSTLTLAINHARCSLAAQQATLSIHGDNVAPVAI